MKKRFFINLLLIALFITCGALSASAPGDILLQLRFYEGIRGPKPAATRVVTAYTLRPLFVGNFISEKGLQQEEEELKRVFNLKDLAVLVQTQWSWERDQSEKRFQIVVLNGHQFLLQVLKLTAVDAFQVQVIDQAAKNKPALLDSEIVLPAGKVSIFGFEDSLSQPYFLAMQRQLDTPVFKEGDLQLSAKPDRTPVPTLLKKVDPVYPEKMLRSGVTASITLQADVNEQGNIWRAHAFSRESEFVKAAIDAVKQWQVEPLVVDGKAQPQTFICTVNFLPSGVALDFSKKTPRPFKAIWPTQGYFTGLFGMRLNPYNHKEEFHHGIDIAAKKGTPVLSTAAGTVTASDFNDQDGHFIRIDHDNGYSSTYHHLDARAVKKGDNVSQGQLIGSVGSSGVSTGPHLHFEIRVNGEPRNPFEFIGPAPGK